MQRLTRRLPQPQPWVTYALLGMVIVSLLLHLLTWISITQFRALARAQVSELAKQVGEAQDDVLSADFPVEQLVPIRATIPVNKQLTIPVSTTVDVNDSVTVPLAGFEFPVPIRASVPINTTVPIVINQTVEVSTTVALKLDVPVRIPIAETSLKQYLQDLEQQLQKLAEQL